MATDNEGVLAIKCRDLVIDNVRVIDNRTRSGVITLRECQDARISRCVVRNYMQVAIDDRTNGQDWGYAFNCTDGTGISVGDSSGTLIEGNRIVIVANNVIVNSFMGMKAMHGSRNVLIVGNQFTKNCLWAIGLMPGVAAHATNTDGGSIIANNIISDFGQGNARWIWGDERSPFRFGAGQQPDDPPLTDVIVQGNMVQNVGNPRYSFAVIIEGGPNAPRGIHFSNNLLPPGSQGVANVELTP
jgi:hypothetical protein